MWYRHPNFGMTLLSDDRGAKEMAEIEKVRLKVDIFILNSLSQSLQVLPEGKKFVGGEQVVHVDTSINVAGESDEDSEDESYKEDSVMDIDFEDYDELEGVGLESSKDYLFTSMWKSGDGDEGN